MRNMTRLKGLLVLVSLLFCFVLAGCHSVDLDEKRVEGVDSAIVVSLPDEPRELPLPVNLDPITQRYLKGSRFYGETKSGLHIGIYTVSVNSQQMYSDLHLKDGQGVSDLLADNIERASAAILDFLNAENVSAEQKSTSVSGEHAVLQTFQFTVGDKKMKAKLLGFTHNSATWILLVACNSDSKNASAVDEIMDSVRIVK